MLLLLLLQLWNACVCVSDPTPCGSWCGFSQVLTGAAAIPRTQLRVVEEDEGREEKVKEGTF